MSVPSLADAWEELELARDAAVQMLRRAGFAEGEIEEILDGLERLSRQLGEDGVPPEEIGGVVSLLLAGDAPPLS